MWPISVTDWAISTRAGQYWGVYRVPPFTDSPKPGPMYEKSILLNMSKLKTFKKKKIKLKNFEITNKT